jgi:DnaJ like chaperone protein
LVTCIVFFAPFPYLIALFHFAKNLGFLQEREGKGNPEKSGRRVLDRIFDALGLKPRGDRYEALYCMAMKVAMTDGRLKNNEAEALNLIVKRLTAEAPPGVELRALRTVQAARTSAVSFLRYAEDFAKRVDGDRVELALALEVLVLVALSDGALDKAQEQMLLDACRVFAIPESRLWSTVSKLAYESTRDAEDAGFANSTRTESSSEKKRTPSGAPETPNAWAYEELGCSTADSQDVIKRRYRALVKEYHPDKLRSRGVSGRVLKQGEQRFLKIQRAYEVLEG